MSLKIDGLPTISQLSSKDRIVVLTDDGLKSLNAEVLGQVFSNTSLYENYNMVELSELNVQNISTNNKVRKYLRNDTSAEVYLEYTNGQVNIIKSTVIMDNSVPTTVQATNMSGKPLYWSEDISEVVYNNGLPWKNQDDEKIFITDEKTEYPVIVYQYTSQYIRKSELSFTSNGDPILIDNYFSSGSSSKGTIEKQGNSFVFQLKESGKNACGLKLSLNEDGTVTGKLIGTWEGVNDWDIEDALTTENFKNWFYHNQDYNVYVNTLSLSTADKIGWYLLKDTSNHIFTEVVDSTIKVYLAQNKESSSGSYIQEQARNMLNQPLYWVEDMTFQSGVSGNHIPIHNGQYTFMTIEETDYPVYIYQYNLTELFTITTESLPDNSRGTKLTFSGLNGKKGEIYKSLTQFVMRYLKADGTEYSKIALGETESVLTGTWKAGTKKLSENELPTQSEATTDMILLSSENAAKWENLDALLKASEYIQELVEKIEALEEKVQLLENPEIPEPEIPEVE